MRKVFAVLVSIFIIVLIGTAGFLVYKGKKKALQKIVSPQEIQEKIGSFFETFYSQVGKPEIVSIESENMYAIKAKIQGQEVKMVATKDGRYFFPMMVDFEEVEKMKKEMGMENPKEIEKRERPDVKLFVMSYCPFGLQAEKALIDAWELLKGKADIGIYFVDYIMHGKEELQENLRQYCIQKTEPEKFLNYLKCFVKEGKSEDCQEKAQIDQQKLKDCEKATDKEFKISESFTEKGFPPFGVHKDLNEKYGVQGSPTLVINDKVVNVERSPEKIKEVICQAFLNPPAECNQKLSEKVASPGFGEGEGAPGSGQCR